MARSYSHHFLLPTGTPVGYGLAPRAGVYFVRFVGPDGVRRKVSTGARSEAAAVSEAAAIILAAFDCRPGAPKTGWDAVTDVVAHSPVREMTKRAYNRAVLALRAARPDLRGPSDVSTQVSAAFVRAYATPARSPNTVRSVVRHLSSLWSKHLKPAGLAPTNPWADTPVPQALRKTPVAPDDGDVDEFLTWLAARYPDWETVDMFVRVKLFTGCRTLDLCSLPAEALRKDRLRFPAHLTKTGADREVPLPPELAEPLRRAAGPDWLWERYAAELPRYRPNPNKVGRPLRPFTPRLMYWGVGNMFTEFNARPERKGKPRLRPHDLRRKAITRAASLVGVDAAAQAIGVNPATARRYYLDAKMAFDTDEVFRQLAAAPTGNGEPGRDGPQKRGNGRTK